MKMRLVILLASLYWAVPALAQRLTMDFHEASMAEALNAINNATPRWNIQFIYDELEQYTVTVQLKDKKPLDAVREIVGFYPMRIITYKNNILVECVMNTSQFIKGRLVDKSREAVPYATVSLYSLSDSTLLRTGVSNENGDFVIPVPANQVLMRVNSMGFEPYEQLTPVKDLDEVTLVTQPFELEELVIQKERLVYETFNNGLVMHVQGTPLEQMGRATELLKFLPGLRYQQQSLVALSGETPVVYIDGVRLMDFSELELLNTEQIGTIQYSQVAGPGQDSQYAVVLNINTVNFTQGSGGRYTGRLSQGRYFGSDQQFRWSLNRQKWDLSAMLDYNTSHLYHKLEVNLQDQSIKNHYNYAIDSPVHTAQAIINGHYKWDNRHRLGLKWDYFIFPKKILKQFPTEAIFTVGANNYFGLNRDSYWLLHYHPRYMANASYTGEENWGSVNVNVDYYKDSKTIDQPAVVQHVNDIANRMWAAKVDVTAKAGNGQLLMGAEYTDTKHTQQYAQRHFVSKSSRQEQQMAAYAHYQTRLGGMNADLGARLENLHSKYFKGPSEEEKNTDGTYRSENKVHLFPYLSISRNGKNTVWSLSYTARSLRPEYSKLNNYSLFGSNLLGAYGNPELQPSISHQIHLQGQAGVFQAGAEYRYIRDYIAGYIEVDKGFYSLHFQNIPHSSSFTAYVQAAPHWGIWHPHFSASLLAQSLKMEWSDGNNMSFSRPMLAMQWANQLQLSPQWMFWTTAQLQSSGHLGTSYQGNTFQLQLGVSHQVGRWTLRLQGYDVLGTAKNKISYYGNRSSYSSLTWYDTQRVEFTLSYRIGKDIRTGTPSGAGQSEKSRF